MLREVRLSAGFFFFGKGILYGPKKFFIKKRRKKS